MEGLLEHTRELVRKLRQASDEYGDLFKERLELEESCLKVLERQVAYERKKLDNA